MSASIAAATITIQDELARTGGEGIADPAGGVGAVGSVHLESLKRRHAFLNEYSDELLRSTPLDTLIKLETTSLKLKNLENSKASEDKLGSNRDLLSSTDYKVESGSDNRWSTLHASRFLPGMGCPVSRMWLRAREVMGGKGHLPIGTYDLAGVGLAGHVTPQGWVAIHDPGNSNLSLRFFSINNCGRRASTKLGDSEDDGLAEVAELGEFKTAVRVLKEAMSFVHPWNKSISAIEGFLMQTNFCASSLENVEKRAQILTQFVDYVLRENSNRWKGHEVFVTVGELKGVWESFFGSRPQSQLTKAAKSGPPQAAGSGLQQASPKQGFKPNKWGVPPGLFLEDICVMWNLGKCVKPPGSCMTKTGRNLRHICNHRPDPNNPARYCGMSHASCFFH